MSIRSKGTSAALTLAMTGALCGVGVTTTSAASAGEFGATAHRSAAAQQRAGADELCAVLGIGSGAAGLTKALAKGASWVGIGASIGCYAYTKAKEATPAQRRAAMIKSYNSYQAKSDLKKLEALGYSCHKKSTGGGGGTDVSPANARIGYRTIILKGVSYTCGNIRD